MHEQDGPMRIGEDMLYEPVPAVGFRIRQPIQQAIALGVFDQMNQVALFLVAEGFAIADEKLKVARVRLIDTGIVNLVDNAVTQRKPETATGVIGGPDALLGA
jgi:hypothetical protein